MQDDSAVFISLQCTRLCSVTVGYKVAVLFAFFLCSENPSFMLCNCRTRHDFIARAQL